MLIVVGVAVSCSTEPTAGRVSASSTVVVVEGDLESRMAEIVGRRLPNGGTLPAPTPEVVSAALADGEVDFDEVLAAARATVACLRDRGVVASDPEPTPGGRFVQYTRETVTEKGADPAAVRAAADSAFADCYATHEALISEAWLRQTSLSEEARQKLIDEIAECLRGTGLDVAPGTAEPEVFAQLGPEATPEQLECGSLHTEALVTPDDGQYG